MYLRGVTLWIPQCPKNKTDHDLECRAKKEVLSQAIKHYLTQAPERDGTLMDFYAMVWMPEAVNIVLREWKEDKKSKKIDWKKYGF